MFEVAEQFMVQFVSLFPAIFGLWLLFDLLGGMLFGKK